MNKLLMIYISCFWSIVLSCSIRDEENFINNELRGILIKVKDQRRGSYTLYIKNFKSKDTLEYTLFIDRKFIEENGISANDSISKEANGHEVRFFKKKNGVYVKSSELYYY